MPEPTELDQVVESVDQLKNSIESRLETIEKGMKAGTISPAITSQGEQGFSLCKMAMGMAYDEWGNAGKEKEIFTERKASVRTQSEDVDSLGGFLVPTDHQERLVMKRRANSVTDKLPTTKMEGLTGGTITMAKETVAAEAFYGQKSATKKKTKSKFGLLKWEPRELSSIVKIPNGLLKRAIPAMDRFLEDALMKAVALRRDIAFLKGTGGEFEPLGVTNHTGINTFDFAGAITYDKLVKFAFELDKNNVEQTERGYAFHPVVRLQLRLLKTVDGFPIFSERFPLGGDQSVMNNQLLSDMFEMTTQLLGVTSPTEMIHGFWPDLVIATWGAIELEASRDFEFDKNMTVIKIVEENDSNVLRPESFTHGTGITFS